MPDYSRGKIYKITSGDLTYIGSTTEPTLARRLADHVSCYKRWKAGKQHFTTSCLLIETGQYEITLVELCPCNSKDELTARERFHIETNVCVNKIIPGRTNKEYWAENPERYKEKQKRKYLKHRDEYLEKARERYTKQQSNRETHSETSPRQEHLSQTA